MRTELDLYAYAGDCLVRGVVSFEGERLTDFLTSSRECAFRDAELTALDDARTIRLDVVTIPTDELLAVVAVGPRGSPGRRIRTRPHPVRVGIGPYELAGYLHATPTADPVTTALRRTFVPVTDGWIRRRRGAEVVEERFEALIINRAEIVWLERAHDEDLALLAPPELPLKVDPLAKDLTPELSLY